VIVRLVVVCQCVVWWLLLGLVLLILEPYLAGHEERRFNEICVDGGPTSGGAKKKMSFKEWELDLVLRDHDQNMFFI
jgi:hypothetical protein